MTKPCDDCNCGMAEDDVDTEEVELSLGMDFSVMVRRYLEKNSDIDETDRILKLEICPGEVVAHLERDALDQPDESGA